MAALGARALLLGLCVLTGAASASSDEKPATPLTPVIGRSSFPPGFLFGAASSAYQYEGAAAEDGRGPSIWDTFSHTHPEKILDGSTGDVAIDFYHRYKGDVALMKDIGLDAFRFSISWSRILPSGSVSGGINPLGIKFYNDLIDELLAKGLQPFVTLFHWDFPQALESEYRGFLSPKAVDDFRAFADVCFREFGDRVKHWITLNEPWGYCRMGYSAGVFAPGRCSPFESADCDGGDSATEPYLCGHHLILAHAAAVDLYRQKYQASQKGVIGITLVTHWFVPYSRSKSDHDAVDRSLDFMLGWFMDPLSEGDYPFSMRALVGDRLPRFSEEESKMVKGSFDFLGLNYYTTYFAKSVSLLKSVNVSYDSDTHTLQNGIRRGVPIGLEDASKSIFLHAKGIRDLLLYIKNRYRSPTIYITENGFDEANNASLPLDKALQDDVRIESYKEHLSYIREAISQGANVKGYLTWSFMDNYEWNSGYTLRFGIVFVDYKNGLRRYPKKSAGWFRNFLQQK